MLNNLARALIDLARYDEALARATRAYDKAVASGNPVVVMQSLFSRVIAHRLQGDLARAGTALREIEVRAATLWREGHPGLVALASEQGELAAARGDFDTAETRISHAFAAAEQSGDEYAIARALLRRATLALARRHGERARADAERALGMFEAAVGANGKSIMAGRAALSYARALLLLGRDDDARRAVTRAAGHFQIVGAGHPELREVNQLLAELGRPSH
ncbi:MAG TPA: hypothetical protein VMO26_12610 [Vicinamibacterales bacterium]|nr:hypothetical protein [Vicinamibacterales bacterium]